jgi:phosphoglycerate dehydrogenase-like enzyme
VRQIIGELGDMGVVEENKMCLDTILKISDIITLKVPHMYETKHMIGTKEFSQEFKSVISINITRGNVGDEKRSYSALRSMIKCRLSRCFREDPLPLSCHH